MRVKQVSVEGAFGWAQAFAAREWPLLLSVALAFYALPGLMLDVLAPDAVRLVTTGLTPNGSAGAAAQGAALGMLALGLVLSLGLLAITALALVPGISVREAILLGARRLPAFLGAVLLAGAALLLAGVVVTLPLAGHVPEATLRAVLWGLAMVGGIVLFIRFLLLAPVLVSRPQMPAAALRRSWLLTRGIGWRLFGAMAAYVVGGLVLQLAVHSVIGVLLALATGPLAAGGIAQMLVALVTQFAAAVVRTGLQLVIVGFYRQLAAG